PTPPPPPPVNAEDMTPPAMPGFGLHGEYFADDALTKLVFTRLDAKVEFQWGGGSPGPGVPGDNFTCRWRGYVLPQYAETYTFWASADDYARITVDGQLLMTTWPNEPRKERGEIELTPDTLHTIVVEHREAGGGASMALYWSSKSQPAEVIPTERLYPPRMRIGKVLYATAGLGAKGKVYLLTPTEGPKELTQAGAAEPTINWMGDTALFTACWHTSWNDPKTVKNTELYSMKPDGADQRRITSNFYPDMMPALSRDGRRVAFVADTANGNRDIYTMVMGGRPRQLTTDAGMDLLPVISPDGKQVAFQTNRNGRWEIFAVNVDGTGEAPLVEGVAWSPAYSPDGKKLLFLSSRGGQTDLYQMLLETQEVIRVTNTPDVESNPLYSPDGSEIAFIMSGGGGKTDIHVMALDGKGLRKMTDTGNVVSFAWGW
ncbi:MAG TPA: PA14 domain-containing protein, partial [Armatimonadota bacterium]|nr:PA14 domain-containing protein [Armatimonadota bacterium]